MKSLTGNFKFAIGATFGIFFILIFYHSRNYLKEITQLEHDDPRLIRYWPKNQLEMG